MNSWNPSILKLLMDHKILFKTVVVMASIRKNTTKSTFTMWGYKTLHVPFLVVVFFFPIVLLWFGHVFSNKGTLWSETEGPGFCLLPHVSVNCTLYWALPTVFNCVKNVCSLGCTLAANVNAFNRSCWPVKSTGVAKEKSWISRIPLWKGLLLRGTRRIPNHQPKPPIYINLPLADMFLRWKNYHV